MIGLNWRPCAGTGEGIVLRSFRDSTYYRAMSNWLHRARQDWNALLAILLVYAVVAIWLGPAYYFVLLYVCLCGWVIRTALKR